MEDTRIEAFKVYEAGGMSNLTYEEQNVWRIKIKKELENCDSQYKVQVCNPVSYYNFIEKEHKSEREVMEFDLDRVRESKLIIANFNAPNSLGTMAEIAIAYEHRIPVIGLNENEYLLYPWQVEMCRRIFNNIDELLDHVKRFYLN